MAANSLVCMLRTVLILGLVLPLVLTLAGQNLPYRGGTGSGYASASLSTPSFLAIYTGGTANGYANTSYQVPSFRALYTGGQDDGYAHISYQVPNFRALYTGGQDDGYAHISYQVPNFRALYTGGQDDGYAMLESCQIYYWSGTVGSGWNIPNNWQGGKVPCYCNPVVIQDTVQTFPAVNAGTLVIGGTHDTGTYNCKQIKIEPGALLTTRVNCFVENYDQILIRGQMLVRNTSPLAFQNFGNIRIRPNGQLVLEP